MTNQELHRAVFGTMSPAEVLADIADLGLGVDDYLEHLQTMLAQEGHEVPLRRISKTLRTWIGHPQWCELKNHTPPGDKIVSEPSKHTPKATPEPLDGPTLPSPHWTPLEAAVSKKPATKKKNDRPKSIGIRLEPEYVEILDAWGGDSYTEKVKRILDFVIETGLDERLTRLKLLVQVLENKK